MIDREEALLLEWADQNNRIFPSPEIAKFEQSAGSKGGGSEHDAWVLIGETGKVVIRRTINDSYGFRFSSPFQYLRRMAEFSAQVPAASMGFLGVSINPRGNGVIWTVQPYIEGTHPIRTRYRTGNPRLESGTLRPQPSRFRAHPIRRPHARRPRWQLHQTEKRHPHFD